MDRTAGFAASLAIRESLIQTLVRVLYNAGRLNPRISVTAPTVSADLFQALPVLSYPPASGHRLVIDLFAWGPMTVTPPGGLPEPRRVKFRARIAVAQTITVANGRLNFGLDTSSAVISQVQIDPYSGGLFSPAAVAYLTSPAFLSLVGVGLQSQLNTFAQLLPPLDIAYLGAIALHPSATTRYVVDDHALVIGLDVSTDEVTTHGNLGLLGDVSGAGNDIGMWTRPSVVPVAYPDVRQQIQKEVDKVGATLDDFNMSVEEGWFAVSGRASKTGGAVNFSVHAVPRLVRPGECFEWEEQYGGEFSYCTPTREELWFDPQDVVVDIDRDWWVVLLEALGGVLTLGIGVMVAEAFIGMIRGNITSGINQNTPSRAERNQDFRIPGVTRPPMRLRIEQFECHEEGVFTGLSITPHFWAATLDGPSFVSAEESLTGTLRFRLDLPPDVLAADPELRIRWIVRRTDTNAILISDDGAAASRLSLTFDGTNVPFLEIAELAIEARVYRTLGAGVDEIFSKQRTLQVTDYVDRSHPYVRWSHQAAVPRVEVLPDGTQRILGLQVVGRRSAIHRTALPGRCRMLRHHSLQKLLPPDPHGFPLEYLDDLPFPLTDIVANRAVLCDYCFFGGPTKDTPLIPIA
ncbi:MAG: hypothetical protein IT178_19960 [Acidobacteria bacterium]|nr:hypothetical protein [Acidobacteriota bacterium]